MQRLLGLLLSLIVLVSPAYAADSLSWQPAADVMFTLTQNTYSDNWSGGDVGSLTWVGIANLGLDKQFAACWQWRNTLKLSYGQSHNQDGDTKDWKKPFKSTDLIDFESLLRAAGSALSEAEVRDIAAGVAAAPIPMVAAARDGCSQFFSGCIMSPFFSFSLSCTGCRSITLRRCW